MKIKRKEICLAIVLSIVLALFAAYSNIGTEEYYSKNIMQSNLKTRGDVNFFGLETQQRSQVISETIEGELDKGTFENTINALEILTEEKDGYVKSLRMIYQDEVWNGLMICKVPSQSVTSFTFRARAIIEANGTVTYININIEDIGMSEQNLENASAYATINLNLRETKLENAVEIESLLRPVLSILTTGLWWITQGLIIGIPLCFTSLGIVVLFSRGIIPLWKNTLRKLR